MMVLATDVLTALTGAEPAPRVVRWLDAHRAERVYLAAVTVGQLAAEVARLPQGRRREDLARRVDVLVDELFAGRVLPYDAAAARTYGLLAAVRERTGADLPVAAGQVAAIARTHHATLVTGDTSTMTGLGVRLVDPWRSTPA